MLGTFEHRVRQLSRGCRTFHESRRACVRAARALVDDALDPVVLPDDRFVLGERRRIRLDNSVHGGQVVSATEEHLGGLRLQQSLVHERRERVQGWLAGGRLPVRQ